MSAWGREDNIIVIANVVFTEGSKFVTNAIGNTQTSSNFSFASNAFGNVAKSPDGGVMAGDYIVLHPSQNSIVDVGEIGNSPKYQIAKVTNAIHLVLTTEASFTANIVHPSIQMGPKYIANISSGTATTNRGNIGSDPGTRNVYSIQRVYGIDKNQANVEFNKHTKGIKTPGWVHMTTHVDRSGLTRHKTEQLVAMSKNGIDHNFDYPSEIHKFNISFTFQPADSATAGGATSNVAGANARLIANATSVPAGAALTYKWLQQNTDISTAFVDTAATQGAAGVTGQASNILFIANVAAMTGQTFICHATTTNEFGIIGLGNSAPVTVELSS